MWLKKFFRENQTPTETLSNNEMARYIRKQMLQLLEIGVTSSDKAITTEKKQSTALSHILRYSKDTIMHANMLYQVLSNPFPLDQKLGQGFPVDPESDQVQPNVYVSNESKGPVYYFGNHLTDPLIHPIENIFFQKPSMYVTIQKIDDYWICQYYFNDQSLHWKNKIGDIYASVNILQLLTFFFSPLELSGNQLLQKFSGWSQIGKANTHYIKSQISGGFLHHQYRFDQEKAISETLTPQGTWYNEDEIRKLAEKREKIVFFSGVKLGTSATDVVKYHIYSVSEQTKILSSEKKTGSEPILSRGLAFR